MGGKLAFDAQTGSFTVGNTITGATSGATGTILSVVDDGTTGTLSLGSSSGTFANNEIIYESALGAELLTDGDMEIDPTNNWTANNAALAEEVVTQHGGAKALKITLSANEGSARQSNTVTALSFYWFVGWEKSEAGDACRLRFRDNSNATNIYAASYTEKTSWTETAIALQMPTGCVSMGFYLNGQTNGDIVYLDDASVKPITNAALANGTLTTFGLSNFTARSITFNFNVVD